MKCSDAGLSFIVFHEGCKLEAYPDPGTGGEPWTIGVGHTGGVKEGDTCTEEQALEWLKIDVGTSERCINNSAIGSLTQEQFDALASLVFNIGCRNFGKSTLLRKLNEGDDEGAAAEFLKWTHANGKVLKGLVTRRKAEMDLFLT